MKKLILITSVLLLICCNRVQGAPVDITLFNACYSGYPCGKIEQPILTKVKKFWSKKGIKLDIEVRDYTIQPGDFLTVYPNQSSFILEETTRMIRRNFLPPHKTDITWINVPIKTPGVSNGDNFLGFGLHETQFLITDETDVGVIDNSMLINLINHELGHVFGLPHVDNEDNLMYHYMLDEPSSKLTDDQLTIIHDFVNEK